MPGSTSLRELGAVRGIGAVLAAATAFGTVSVLVRAASEAGSRPIPLLGARLLVAAVILSVLVRAPWRVLGRRESLPVVVAGCAFAAAGLGEFQALSRAEAPAVVLLVFVAPAWIALGAWALRGESLGWPRALALCAMFCGLALVVTGSAGQSLRPSAATYALAASAFSAAFFVSLELAGRTLTPCAGACLATWIGAAVVIPLDARGVADELLSTRSVISVLAIGVLTACALVLLASAVRTESAFTASAVICVEPLVAVTLSWLALDELLTTAQLAAGVMILLSVAALSMLTVRAPPWPGATGRTRPPRPGSRPRRRPAKSARRRRSGGRWRG
jgi:drug/metabolite transporter (DMT)-like permease